MINRIKRIMEYSQLSQKDFANTLGISESSLSSIFNGRTRPTNNHTQAIHKAYPTININWLLFDEGDMLNDQSNNKDDYNSNFNTNKDDGIIDLFSDVEPVATTPTLEPIRKQQAVVTQNNSNSSIQQDAKNIDIKKREIKEIRVFFDDGTYETFSMSK
ncbi:MAG: helix-turn-helix transcriptional regulator [Prevotellaceae bacterium]|nr:helix-turn-helix transcriptional regulator [Candidatus Faecinaster equi]